MAIYMFVNQSSRSSSVKIKQSCIQRYRCLSDVLEMYLNPDHKYYPDVSEFFSTIIYLDGRRTFNFIRGPMRYGEGSGFWDKQNVGKSKINLGGASESSCESRKTPFTTKSELIKYLSLLQYKLMNCGSDDSSEPIVNNKNLLVYPYVYSNDRTALMAAV